MSTRLDLRTEVLLNIGNRTDKNAVINSAFEACLNKLKGI